MKERADRVRLARRAVPLLLALASWAPVGRAHGDLALHLAGQRLCLDPDAVAVTVAGPDPLREAAVRRALRSGLEARLEQAIGAGPVASIARPSCAGAPAAVLFEARVRYLDPSRYAGFGERAYGFDLDLRVGARGESGAEVQRLRYVASESDIHAEGETATPVEVALVARGEALLRGLAAAWREDNPPWRRARAWLLSGGAVAAALVVGFALRNRWNALRDPRRAQP